MPAEHEGQLLPDPGEMSLPDPVAARYKPPPELLTYAHNRLILSEEPGERFVRQRYEEALGALRVVIQSLREIYPTERYYFDSREWMNVREALHACERASIDLDAVEEQMLGAPMRAVLRGHVTSIDRYKQLFESDDQA